MREPELKELQGASKLSRGFFNRLIRRIEFTKPIAGDNVTIIQQDDGFKISAAAGGSSKTYPSVTMTIVDFGVTPLQVCSGGTTQTIYVLSTTNSSLTSVTMLKASTTDSPFKLLTP